MRFRQALIQYAEKYGVTKAAIRYRVNRQYVYRWKKRYDGTPESLADRSHRPHHHPDQHTEEELKLIRNMRRRNPNTGLVVLWVKLRQRGYTRSVSGLYRVLTRSGQMAVKLPNPKYIPKPYEPMQYPGQRGQIDVKFVPAACLVGETEGKKFYQYTFIDEYSRFRYLEAFEEHSTYTSALFIKHVVEKFPYVIECIQTDNGTEFTNRLNSKKQPRKPSLNKPLRSWESGISSSALLHRATTGKWSVRTVKIMKNSMPHTSSFPFMISKSNSLFANANTITSL